VKSEFSKTDLSSLVFKQKTSFSLSNWFFSKTCFFLMIEKTCGLYYKQVTIVIYDCNDSGQYYKTTITIVIDDPSLSWRHQKWHSKL
jgi:hypothetical protein